MIMNIPMNEMAQPLDAIMTRLGLTNADLVKVSTEQLSFKVAQKGRKGHHLTPNLQDKILNALLAARPGLSFKRRDLFRYPPSIAMVGGIEHALDLVRNQKIDYPQFVDRLAEAGVIGYTAEPGPNRITFHGFEGEAYVEQGVEISPAAPGSYDEKALRSAIVDAQARKIDHPEFLRRIHAAGIGTYEVNIRKRRIEYKGEGRSHKETIPPAEDAAPLKEEKVAPPLSRPTETKGGKFKKKPGVVRTTRKARLSKRKNYFQKRKNKRSRRK